MSLYDTVRTSLYNATTKIITTNQVIHSHQGGQEPKGTYVAINVVRLTKVGAETDASFAGLIEGQADAYELYSRNEYETTVRFMFVGTEAGNLAHDFETIMDNYASRFYFSDENLAVMRKTDIRRVPEKRDTTWVDNFTIDVIFSYAVETTQNIDIIDNVTWNENIN